MGKCLGKGTRGGGRGHTHTLASSMGGDNEGLRVLQAGKGKKSIKGTHYPWHPLVIHRGSAYVVHPRTDHPRKGSFGETHLTREGIVRIHARCPKRKLPIVENGACGVTRVRVDGFPPRTRTAELLDQCWGNALLTSDFPPEKPSPRAAGGASNGTPPFVELHAANCVAPVRGAHWSPRPRHNRAPFVPSSRGASPPCVTELHPLPFFCLTSRHSPRSGAPFRSGGLY